MFTVPKLTTREITTLGLLVALEIVLARFCSIQAWNLRIGFSFLPIAMASIRFGPIPAAMAGPRCGINKSPGITPDGAVTMRPFEAFVLQK